MQYIYDFDIGSILFFGLTIFVYLYQKRMRNIQDSVFTAMLICAMIAVVFDFASSSMEYYALRHPVWLLQAVNMLFILGMQTCLPLFLLYAVASAGKLNRFSTRGKLAAAIPYLLTIALLLASPFTRMGIFYIDEQHIYQHGMTHSMLYINMGVYVLAGVAVLLLSGSRMPRAKRNVILIFVVELFVAMMLQLLLPRYLLTASATALALTSVFYVLQSPVDQVDPLTQAFSRTLMPALLQDYEERGRAYALLLVSIRSFDEYVRLYGYAEGNALLGAYAEALMSRFASKLVVFMDTSEFVVVLDGDPSRLETERLRLQTPEAVAVNEHSVVQLDIRLGVVPHEEGEPVSNVLTTTDYMLHEMRLLDCTAVLLADGAYKRRCGMSLQLEASIGVMLRENRATWKHTPVVDKAGEIVCEEAQLCAPDELAPYATPRQFRQAAGRSGYAEEYYRALLRAFAPRRAYYTAQRRLCVSLLSAVFLQDDAPERILAFVTELGFEPAQILFAVDEAELAVATPVPAENVRKLTEYGFAFMVDTFAEGYTDMSLIISLPLRYARIHESLIHNAAANADDAKLLTGLIGVLADVGITAICPGVDSAAARRTACRAGATLLQGEYAILTL